MESVLQKMLAQLSESDQQKFDSLANKLKVLDGDISRLSPEDKVLIVNMEKKYSEQLKQAHKSATSENKQQNQNDIDILTLPFAQHARQILARDLGEKFPIEEDAVAFAFDNKWLPIECRDKSLAEDLFEKYQQDILETNQWRQELLEVGADRVMAVGLTWFMVVFQLNKKLNG